MSEHRKTPLEQENERLRQLVHDMHAHLNSVAEEMGVALRAFDAALRDIPDPRDEEDGDDE